MVLQVLVKKPSHVFELPSPGVITLPALLDSRLHDSGLSQVPLLRGL